MKYTDEELVMRDAKRIEAIEKAVRRLSVSEKRSAFVLMCLIFLASGCQRPTNPYRSNSPENVSSPLLPVKVAGKYGYVNGTGQLVINPQFDAAQMFTEGRAPVCIGKPCSWFDGPGDSRWGFIDVTGKFIVSPQYAAVAPFSEGLASVCTEDCTSTGPESHAKRGYVDLDGKMVIQPQFAIALNFADGLAQVCIGACNWVKDEGYNGKFGFIDQSGHFVVNPIYDNAGDFEKGYASVTIGKGDEAKTGYIDKTGKVLWQPSN